MGPRWCSSSLRSFRGRDYSDQSSEHSGSCASQSRREDFSDSLRAETSATMPLPRAAEAWGSASLHSVSSCTASPRGGLSCCHAHSSSSSSSSSTTGFLATCTRVEGKAEGLRRRWRFCVGPGLGLLLWPLLLLLVVRVIEGLLRACALRAFSSSSSEPLKTKGPPSSHLKAPQRVACGLDLSSASLSESSHSHYPSEDPGHRSILHTETATKKTTTPELRTPSLGCFVGRGRLALLTYQQGTTLPRRGCRLLRNKVFASLCPFLYLCPYLCRPWTYLEQHGTQLGPSSNLKARLCRPCLCHLCPSLCLPSSSAKDQHSSSTGVVNADLHGRPLC